MASAMCPVAGLGPSSTRAQALASARMTPRLSKAASRMVVVRSAAEDPDAELEKRLEKLRQVKGATPYGQGSKSDKGAAAVKTTPGAKPDSPKRSYDFTNEKVYYEGGPHGGDLAVNMALGATLAWLPLTAAAVGRAAFVKYRFTDLRFTVTTNAPWSQETLDVPYQEVKEIVTIGRGVGLWGDMVVTLRDNSKVEMRALDRWQELKAYILQRRDELLAAEKKAAPPSSGAGPKRGGIVTAAELMGEDVPAPKEKKGFA